MKSALIIFAMLSFQIYVAEPKPAMGSGICPPGQQRVSCFIDPCRTAFCPPNTICESNYCGGCHHECVNAMSG